MASYKELIQELTDLKNQGSGSNVNIQPESVARMRLQNQFQSGLDIARYTAAIMRKDMEERMQRSVDSRFDDVGSQLASVRSEVQAINDATNDSAGKNDVHQQAIDQLESYHFFYQIFMIFTIAYCAFLRINVLFCL